MENAKREHQQSAPNVRRRERVQPRNNDEDFKGEFCGRFDDEEDRASM